MKESIYRGTAFKVLIILGVLILSLVFYALIKEKAPNTPTKLINTITGGSFGLQSPDNAIQDESTGKIYIADSAKACIAIFSKDGSFLTSFGKSGFGDGYFSYPYGMVITPQGTIWISDPPNRTIQEFTLQGKFVRRIFYGSDGSEPGMMVRNANQVFVSDLARSQIIVLDLKGKQINPCFNQTPVDHPQQMSFDSTGNLWVSSEGTGSIQVFRQDGTQVSQLNPTKGTKDLVRGLAIDNQDRVWTSFPLSGKVQMIGSSGEVLLTLNSKGVEPTALWINKRNQILIVDQARNVVEVWSGGN